MSAEPEDGFERRSRTPPKDGKAAYQRPTSAGAPYVGAPVWYYRDSEHAPKGEPFAAIVTKVDRAPSLRVQLYVIPPSDDLLYLENFAVEPVWVHYCKPEHATRGHWTWPVVPA